MADFVDDYTDVPETKVDATAVPATASTTKYVRASDINTLSGAASSVRAAVLNSRNVVTASASSGSVAIALAGHTFVAAALDADLTVSNPTTTTAGAASRKGIRITFHLTQDATGGRGVTFGANFTGAQNFLPRQGPSQESTIEFVSKGDGTWRCAGFDGIDLSDDVSALDFGADNTGATECAAAIQRAFNFFSANTSTGGSPRRSGGVYFPPGSYQVATTIEYVGAPAYSFRMRGIGRGQDSKATTFKWTGANTGESRVFRFQGSWHLVLSDFFVNCNGRAKHGIQVEPFEKTIVAGTPPTNYVGSSYCTYENVDIGSVRNTDGASGWLVGYIPAECPGAGGEGLQCDEQTWLKCSTGMDYVGDSYEIAGWRIMQGDNVKNLNWTFGQAVGGRYGVKAEHVLEGSCKFTNFFGGGFKGVPGDADRAGCLVYGGGEHVKLDTCGLEGTTDVRFVADAGGYNGNNYGTWALEDCYFAGPCPTDDYVIRVSGAVTLNRCDFGNSRTGSSPSKLALNIVDANGNHAKATIRDCQFKNVTDYAAVPAFDWNGNHMVMDEYAIIAGVNLDASNNNTLNSGVEVRLSDTAARPGEMVRAKLKLSQTGSLESGASFVVNGLENGYVARSNHVYTGWQAGSASFSNRVTSIPVPPGALGVWLKRVVVDVSTLIAAGAATISFKLGTTSGGNELLLSKVLSGALPKNAGRLAADLGASMTAETLGVTLTATTDVYLTLTASAGNLSAMTAGAWSIRYFYEVLW